MSLPQYSDFVPHLNSQFSLVWGEEAANILTVELVEVNEMKYDRPNDLGKAFSLLFRGPAEPLLSQGSYQVGHPIMEELMIFVVPIRQTPEGVEYHAVFN